MVVRVLCEWEEFGNDDYVYVEWIEVKVNRDCINYVNFFVNKMVLRSILNQGIVISKIKEIEREYVRSA